VTRCRPAAATRRATVASVFNPECRTVLGLALAPIVEAGGRDIRVSQPLLHLGDIGIVRQRVRRRSRAQRVDTEAVDLGADAGCHPVFADDSGLLPGFIDLKPQRKKRAP
jgi:hypothetical protein